MLNQCQVNSVELLYEDMYIKADSTSHQNRRLSIRRRETRMHLCKSTPEKDHTSANI